jgi:DNA-binding PadR family transcriptional regulator
MSMQEPTFLVLTVLAGPPLHGYGIMRAIEEISPGGGTLRPGTLYAALDRLTQAGLVEVAREDEWADRRVRRYYRLTPPGSQALRAEAERRRELATVAMFRLSTLRGLPGTDATPSPA